MHKQCVIPTIIFLRLFSTVEYWTTFRVLRTDFVADFIKFLHTAASLWHNSQSSIGGKRFALLKMPEVGNIINNIN